MGGYVAEVKACFWMSRTGTCDDLAEERGHFGSVIRLRALLYGNMILKLLIDVIVRLVEPVFGGIVHRHSASYCATTPP